MKTTAAQHSILALLIACLLLPLSIFAAESGVSQTEFQAYKKDAQVKLDETKDSLPAKVKERMDERVGDLAHHLTILSIVIGAFGVLLTVVGLVGWVSVKDRASNEVRDWIEEKGQEKLGELIKQKEKEFDADLKQRMDNRIIEFEAKLGKMEKEVVVKKNEVIESFDKLEAEAKQANPTKQQPFPVSRNNTVPSNKSPLVDKEVGELADVSKNKPEAEYTFDDWNTLAFDAWGKSDLETAVHFWKSAAKAQDAIPENAAQALYNAGVASGLLERDEEAIAVYDDVISLVGVTSEIILSKLIARTLFNKGAAQGRLERSKEAIESYRKVVKDFGDRREIALRDVVAGALINIGIELDKSGDCEEALEMYNEVLKRLDKTNEPVLREQVAKAKHAKSTGLSRHAKENWPDEGNRSDALRAALALLEQAEENLHDKPRVWGDQSYVTFLLGQPDKARSLLKRSLQQSLQPPPQTTTFPSVPPDPDFIIMSNEVWAEVQRERNAPNSLP